MQKMKDKCFKYSIEVEMKCFNIKEYIKLKEEVEKELEFLKDIAIKNDIKKFVRKNETTK